MPIIIVWNLIIDEFNFEIKYYYCVEEPSLGVYINTDELGLYLPIRYSVDYSLYKNYNRGSEKGFYVEDEQEVIDEINYIMGRRYRNIKQLKKQLYNEYKKI